MYKPKPAGTNNLHGRVPRALIQTRRLGQVYKLSSVIYIKYI